ncbi:unnamed protein product [Sphagnum compactum]
MRSTTPSPSPSPSLRERLPSREHTAALQTLSRLSTDEFAEKPFAGLVICVTGLSKEARKQVQIMTERMGGHCSGRKFEYALRHGLHRGLLVVTLPWFLNSAKHYERLDETLYIVQKCHTNGSASAEIFSDTIATSSWQNSCLPASREVGNSLCLQPNVHSVSKGTGLLKNTLSTPNHVPAMYNLAGTRLYVDPDLPSEVQDKVQEAAESCGATCVEIWSKKNNATHVVCESTALPKYIGLNLHLVSPMWVMSVQGGCPLRCVQYSADLARNIADLVLSGKSKSRHSHNEMHPYLRPGNEQTAEARVQDRQEKATFAKAGVRRRRIHMQPCRTLPRMITPLSLLESICWVITDSPSTAQVYINSRARPDNGPVTEEMQDNEHHHSHDQDCCTQDHEHLGGISEEFYAQPLSEREKQEIVFRGAFLTILFPIDRFVELGPSSRTFFSEEGFSREKILELVFTFYQAYLSIEEIEVAIHTDSKHADRLRSIYSSKDTEELGYVPMRRAEFLGSRRQFEGLKRIGQDNTGQMYDLLLSS